jgi:hypothetical protein
MRVVPSGSVLAVLDKKVASEYLAMADELGEAFWKKKSAAEARPSRTRVTHFILACRTLFSNGGKASWILSRVDVRKGVRTAKLRASRRSTCSAVLAARISSSREAILACRKEKGQRTPSVRGELRLTRSNSALVGPSGLNTSCSGVGELLAPPFSSRSTSAPSFLTIPANATTGSPSPLASLCFSSSSTRSASRKLAGSEGSSSDTGERVWVGGEGASSTGAVEPFVAVEEVEEPREPSVPQA